MVNQNQFFDLYDIFVNELIGDVWLTVIIGLIVVWFLCIKAKMPFELSILFGVLWLAIIFAETNLLIIWIFIVLFVGTLFYYVMSKGMEGR